jgi:hypothetical protein
MERELGSPWNFQVEREVNLKVKWRADGVIE